MRRLLLVAPQFPPSSLAGAHRPRLLAKHLAGHGWEPVVLRVDERDYEERLDPGLAELVPASVRREAVRGVPARWARPLGVGDLSLRAYPGLARRSRALLRAEDFDAVLVTVAPNYTALLGASLARRTGVPLVLDFQDPWVSAYGASRPPLSKAGIAHRLAVHLEPRALRWASHVTAVSDGTNAGIRRRYPAFPTDRFTTIPIGFDPEDSHPARSASRCDTDGFHVYYVGTIWPRVLDTLRAVLRAVAMLRESEPGLYARLKLHFVGTTYGPAGTERPQVLPIAEEEGVLDRVEERPARVGYLDALRLMGEADLLLLLGSDEPHYSASKLYPYLLSGRPVLGLLHEESDVCGIAAEVGGARLLTFSRVEPALGRTAAFASALAEVMRDPASVGRGSMEKLRPYTADGVAARFADVLDRVVAGPSAVPWW